MTTSKAKNKKGKVFHSKKALIKPHELRVAEILIRTGDNVYFIPVNALTKTPDIYYQGKNWEIKSPVGRSSGTLERNIKNALKQSENIIIDLSRIKLDEEKCMKTLINIMKRYVHIKSMIIVRANEDIITLK